MAHPSPSPILSPDLRRPGQVVLTFDDGPRGGRTDVIAACLDRAGVTGTFYVIGEVAEDELEWVASIAEGGHRIGNHGWDHQDFATLSDAEIRDQIQRTDAVIEAATGTVPRWVRPPYGSPWFGDPAERERVERVLLELGKGIALWQVDSRDWSLPGRPAQIVGNVTDRLDAIGGGVCLFHDIHQQTVEALPGVLDAIEVRGLDVVDEDTLLGGS